MPPAPGGLQRARLGGPGQACEERASRAAPAGGGQARLWAPRATGPVVCRAGRLGARSRPQDPVCGGPQGRVTPPPPQEGPGWRRPRNSISPEVALRVPSRWQASSRSAGCPLPAAPPSAWPAPPPRPARPPLMALGPPHGGPPSPLWQPFLVTAPSVPLCRFAEPLLGGWGPASACQLGQSHRGLRAVGEGTGVRTQVQTQAPRPPPWDPVLPFPVASVCSRSLLLTELGSSGCCWQSRRHDRSPAHITPTTASPETRQALDGLGLGPRAEAPAAVGPRSEVPPKN